MLSVPDDSAAARKPAGRRKSTGYVVKDRAVAVRKPKLVFERTAL